jgi:hypothetical protein
LASHKEGFKAHVIKRLYLDDIARFSKTTALSISYSRQEIFTPQNVAVRISIQKGALNHSSLLMGRGTLQIGVACER